MPTPPASCRSSPTRWNRKTGSVWHIVRLSPRERVWRGVCFGTPPCFDSSGRLATSPSPASCCADARAAPTFPARNHARRTLTARAARNATSPRHPASGRPSRHRFARASRCARPAIPVAPAAYAHQPHSSRKACWRSARSPSACRRAAQRGHAVPTKRALQTDSASSPFAINLPHRRARLIGIAIRRRR